MSEDEFKQIEAEKERRKSLVRVRVTYAAAGFLFLGGTIFIVFLIWVKKIEEAIDLFLTLLPVSASIVSFWFAGRVISSTKHNGNS